MQRLTNKKYKINARGRHLTGYFNIIQPIFSFEKVIKYRTNLKKENS